MKSNLGLLIKSLMLAGFLLCSVPVFAEDPANQKNVVTERSSGLWPEEITLDRQVFKKDQLNQAFLDAVFIADVLNKRGEQLILGIPVEMPRDWILHPETLKVGYPWLYPHIYPQDGLPRTLSVNKWVKPVRITLGMPNDLKPFSAGIMSKDRLYIIGADQHKVKEFEAKGDYELLVKDMLGLLTRLSDLTNIDIGYLAHEQETLGNYADIRINFVPLFVNKPENQYKVAQGLAEVASAFIGTYISFRGVVEKHIKTGFPFTSVSARQVDGYILSNSKNEIQAAVCYIWIGHEPEMIKALVRECLIRSLGLPGAMRMNFAQRPVPASYLTLWNDPEKWSESYRSQVKAPVDVSEFDQYMIRTLYNPAIKPGMDYMAAQRILLGTEY